MEETTDIVSFLCVALKYIKYIIEFLLEFILVTKCCIGANFMFLLWYKRFTKSDTIFYLMPFFELLLVWVLFMFKPLLSDWVLFMFKPLLVDVIGEEGFYFKILICIPFVPLVFLTVVKISDIFKKDFLNKILR
tara:strand:- start:5636 stop:6037 length:402 start_codon:yes stop_codon:yes gene_type:complete